MNRLILILLSISPFLSEASTIRLPGLDEHKKLRASDLSKGPTVLQFWASWCRSCSEVFYDMKEATTKSKGVSYFTISIDEDYNTMKKYLEKHPLNQSLYTRTDPPALFVPFTMQTL